MAEYQYVFTDLATDQVRTELPCTNVSFTREVNGPGGWSAELPLSIVKDGYELVRASELAEADTALYVLRDNVVVFGGILWAVNASSDQETLRVGGQGFWSYFRRLDIRNTKAYSDVEQFDIVEDLIDYLQGFTGSDLGVTVARTPTNSGITRDRRYPAHEFKNGAEAIEQLASVVNGFDFELEAGGSFGAFTKTLQLWYPQRGRKTDIVWEVGKNVQLLDYTADGSARATVATALGEGDGSRMLVAHATDSTAPTLRMVRVDSFRDVNRIETLQAHAQAQLNLFKRSHRSARVQVVNQADAPLGSYIPGDQVRLRVSRGYLDIDESWRIMSYTVQPDDSGSEIVTAELLPVDAFAT